MYAWVKRMNRYICSLLLHCSSFTPSALGRTWTCIDCMCVRKVSPKPSVVYTSASSSSCSAPVLRSHTHCLWRKRHHLDLFPDCFQYTWVLLARPSIRWTFLCHVFPTMLAQHPERAAARTGEFLHGPNSFMVGPLPPCANGTSGDFQDPRTLWMLVTKIPPVWWSTVWASNVGLKPRAVRKE